MEKWKVDYYNKIVADSFTQWPIKLKGRFVKLVELMEENGADLGMPHTRALGDGLFELRVKGKEGIGRAFFCYWTGKKITILSGYIKKTQKIPKGELKLAKDRLYEVKNYGI
ncbi:MAG: hypothetical protein A2103_00555 [Gammaproteobacteria bacterium GWF2_41_13]|nr:MAG: hypothetical protein A2103_00555 [Gammaproteobacteria bacterium GWF2_41_13]